MNTTPQPIVHRPILHHYASSPFSEKVRLILGFKGIDWRSVHVPVIMPKSDLQALTGGYRRAPVLQIGADVYCDSALIARVLETLQPEPTLFPTSAPLAPLFAQWADSTLFWTVIPYTMQPAGLAHVFAGQSPETMKAFAADRGPFAGHVKRPTAAEATLQLQQVLHALELQLQLQGGQAFLFGEAVSIADFSVAHCLWFVHRAPPMATILAPHGHVGRWLDRMLAIGHGRPERLSGEEAIDTARAATPAASIGVLAGQGLDEGQAVSVAASDYGSDPVQGVLVGLGEDEVVIARRDPRAGLVHVHAPRRGFQVRKSQETAA